jgi:hypothetical protein
MSTLFFFSDFASRECFAIDSLFTGHISHLTRLILERRICVCHFHGCGTSASTSNSPSTLPPLSPSPPLPLLPPCRRRLFHPRFRLPCHPGLPRAHDTERQGVPPPLRGAPNVSEWERPAGARGYRRRRRAAAPLPLPLPSMITMNAHPCPSSSRCLLIITRI